MKNKETLEVGAYQQELFSYLHDLGIIALQSEMQEIERIVLSMQEQDKKMYNEEDMPTPLEPVLAKITHQNDLGLSQWYEVVLIGSNGKWCCYSGSKTFKDGERVITWKYCKDLI